MLKTLNKLKVSCKTSNIKKFNVLLLCMLMLSTSSYAYNSSKDTKKTTAYDPTIYKTYNDTDWQGEVICSTSIIQKAYKILACARVVNGVRQSYLYFEKPDALEVKRSGWLNGSDISMSIPFRNVLGASFKLTWKRDRITLSISRYSESDNAWVKTYYKVAKPIVVKIKGKILKSKGKELIIQNE